MPMCRSVSTSLERSDFVGKAGIVSSTSCCGRLSSARQLVGNWWAAFGQSVGVGSRCAWAINLHATIDSQTWNQRSNH